MPRRPARPRQKETGPPVALTDVQAGAQRRSLETPEVIALGVASLALIALGYTVYPIISPFVLVGCIVFLLYPFRDRQLARRIIALSVVLFLLWFFYSILGLLTPFILTFLLAYILDPPVTLLERRGFPRWASSLIAVILLVGAVVAVILFLMPVALQQFNEIIGGVSFIVREFAQVLQSGAVFEFLDRYGIPVEKAREVINEQISPRLQELLRTLFLGVFGLFAGISNIVLHIINAVIVPFLVFYILKDFPLILDRFVRFIPAHRRVRTIEMAQNVDRLIGRYLRGAIAVAFIQATISATCLTVIGVRFSLVLGIMTGILNFIPYVGLITSLIVSCIVALFSGGAVLTKVILVIILYLTQKLLEATILAPKIIGAQVGLHPVVLILCLLVFGYFLGFVGLLIAVPATALIIAGVFEWEARKQEMAGAVKEA